MLSMKSLTCKAAGFACAVTLAPLAMLAPMPVAAKVLATGDFTPIDTAAGKKYPLGGIEVKKDGKKRLVVGDLRLKIVRMNRSDADELLEFVETHA